MKHYRRRGRGRVRTVAQQTIVVRGALVKTFKQSALALATCLLAASGGLRAQDVAPYRTVSTESIRTSLPPLASALATRDTARSGGPADRPVLFGLEQAAQRRREWWVLPLAGAVAGGLIGLTIDDRCPENDCMISIPPAVTFAVYGGALGLLLEIAL